VALTAYAGEPHRQAALDAGFTEHVGKPVDPEQLAAIIGGLTRREPT
jgi:CheY-like chemotaxis protein